jgi:hypothetical protein
VNNRPALYRSTLIAAAVAIGCFGAAAAQAHDQGWRGHDEGRGWHGHDRGWRERGEYRGAHAHGGRPGAVPGYGYEGPGGLRAWAALPPLPPPLPFGPGGVSVVLRLPF